MDDSDHQLAPDHLPTPFTAAQIRAATPEGHTVETITEASDGTADPVVVRSRTTFVSCDEIGAVMRRVELDESGAETGAAVEARSTWAELQGHASFPAAIARRSHARLDHPLGRLDCLRYDVEQGPDHVVFWFSVAHPGMPVRFETRRDGRAVTTTTVAAMPDAT
jgi:hypothetical protein